MSYIGEKYKKKSEVPFNPSARIGNYIYYEIWDKITYPLPDFNGVGVYR